MSGARLLQQACNATSCGSRSRAPRSGPPSRCPIRRRRRPRSGCTSRMASQLARRPMTSTSASGNPGREPLWFGARSWYRASTSSTSWHHRSGRPPRWAKRMEVDVDVSPDLWDEMTDFSLTAYDSTGQQLRGGNQPMNYAFGRLGVTFPDSLKGRPVVVELYPAFARLPGHSWKGRARIRFLGLDEPVGEPGELSVVAGGRAVEI